MTTPNHQDTSSTLANLMDWMQQSTPMLLSFEDLSGITYDYPQLALSERLRRHVRPFCDLAKFQSKGASYCPINKSKANQAAIAHGASPLVGCCYLGLTDICHVLRYQNRVMGVFYFGSVIRKGQLDMARDRVREVCHQDPKRIAAMLRMLAKVPVVTNAQIDDATARLEQLAQMVGLILSGLSIPAGLYETYPSNRLAAERAKLTHPMIHRALRIIEQQHAKPLTLDVIAGQLRCHPGYLSRLFRQQVGKPVSDYLRQTRIDRACRLLRLGQMDVTAVGMEVGFEDKSNFGRAFRHVMHMSPGQFRQQAIGQ